MKPTIGRMVIVHHWVSQKAFGGFEAKRRVSSPATVTRVVDQYWSIDAVVFLSSEEWVGNFSSFKPTLGMRMVPSGAPTDAYGPFWTWPERE